MDIKLPKLAEGAESGTIVSILVSVGDNVEKDQTIIELENEKAVAPIPSTTSGTVSAIHVKEGDTVSSGQTLITLSSSVNDSQPSPSPSPQPQPVQPQSLPQPTHPPGTPPPASPSARKIAMQLGLDLSRVPSSSRGGRITLDDIRNYIAHLQSSSQTQSQSQPQLQPSIDFSKFGKIKKEPFASLRKTIAKKMQSSWQTIPHVTQFDDADITDLMKLRKKYKADYQDRGAGLTLTSFAIKACLKALKEFPIFNTSLDENTNELIHKEYFHLGIAVDTESGLIVPVIKDVDKKSLLELSTELGELAEKTRSRKISAEELQGACFTISNLGGIGGTHFSPIVNHPQVAILGLGRGVTRAVVTKDNNIEPRIMLPLAVSYDHRVIDGADAARFIRSLVESFENFSEDEVKI